jgi:hypothetical protein
MDVRLRILLVLFPAARRASTASNRLLHANREPENLSSLETTTDAR